MKFSISIPAFKRSYLKEAIDSCLAQTYEDFELIIVNDASPEDLDSIVNSYSDNRIRYYKNETNIGGKDPVANWNKCLSYAQGEFFCLLCDDDIYAPSFLETMLSLAEKYPHCNVFKSRVKTIDKKGKVLTYFPSSPEWEPVSDYLWHVAYGHRKQTVSEWMYRTQRMREIGGYAAVPMAWGADYLSTMLFGAEGGICASIKPLVIFRRSGENISNNYAHHVMEKLEGTQVYTQKLRKMVEDYKMDDSLYPIIEKIRRDELMATMGISRWIDLMRAFYYKQKFDISMKMIGLVLLNRFLRTLR